jgi:hypothetical protein
MRRSRFALLALSLLLLQGVASMPTERGRSSGSGGCRLSMVFNIPHQPAENSDAP